MDQRSNWAVGDSPVGNPAATPSEPHAHMLKVVTDHRRSTLVEFLQVTLPKIAKQWTSRPFAFSGRAPQPEPWMWQESQALQMAGSLRMYCKGWISFNFSIFFIIYTTYRKKKITRLTAKINFFL